MSVCVCVCVCVCVFACESHVTCLPHHSQLVTQKHLLELLLGGERFCAVTWHLHSKVELTCAQRGE